MSSGESRPAEPRETEREKVTGADMDPVTKLHASSLLKVVNFDRNFLGRISLIG